MPVYENMGVFPSKSDKSPLKRGHPHLNKHKFTMGSRWFYSLLIRIEEKAKSGYVVDAQMGLWLVQWDGLVRTKLEATTC